jgi:phenylacetate-CoA ligase
MTEAGVQNIKLKELLNYVSVHSAFYKRLFKKHTIDPANISTLEDLRKIPFTEKEDLQAATEDFICVPKNKLVDYVTTSGTTGKPVSIALTDKDLDRLAYNECNSFKTAGVSENDIIQLMTTMDRRFMAGLAYFLGARKLGAGIVRVGNGIPQLQWDTILQVKPTVIVCVPSFILKLIEFAEANRIDYKNCSVKKAICIGEPIRNPDFSLNMLGKKITQKWNLQLHSTYASTEMAAAFTECEAMRGGHLQEDLLIAEIIDEQGKHVADGQPGELIITTLGVEGMPLIRFKTGDICIAHTEACSCGRKELRLSPVLGRKKQMIKYKGTSLYPNALYEVLENIEYIKNYQVEVFTNQLGTDEIAVNISSSKNSPETEAMISDAFRSKLRVVPKINFYGEAELNAMLLPENMRKPLKFIDNRKNNYKA